MKGKEKLGVKSARTMQGSCLTKHVSDGLGMYGTVRVSLTEALGLHVRMIIDYTATNTEPNSPTQPGLCTLPDLGRPGSCRKRIPVLGIMHTRTNPPEHSREFSISAFLFTASRTRSRTRLPSTLARADAVVSEKVTL